MNPISWLFSEKYKEKQQEPDKINQFKKREIIKQKQPEGVNNKRIKRYTPEEVRLDLPEEWTEKRADFTIYLNNGKFIRCHEEIADKVSVLGGGGLLDNAATVNQPVEGARPIIEYLYSGKIELTDQNIEAIARVAHKWKVEDVLYECVNFIESAGHIDICLKLWKKGIPFLNKYVLNFLLNNAQSLKKSPLFPHISLDHLFELLENSSINVKTEYELLNLILIWGKTNCPDDKLLGEFLRSLTSENGRRLIDTIDFSSIHPMHMLDVIGINLLSNKELQNFAKTFTEKLASSPSYKQYKTKCDLYEKDHCKRAFVESSYFPTDWKPNNYNEKSEFDGNRVKTFWRLDDMNYLIENMKEGKVKKTTGFERKCLYKHEYILTCSVTSDNYLQFFLESNDLLTTEDGNQEDFCVALKLSLVNQFDREKHINKCITTKIQDGECPDNLAEEDSKLKIGKKLIRIDDLLDHKKGWIVSNEMILSAEIEID